MLWLMVGLSILTLVFAGACRSGTDGNEDSGERLSLVDAIATVGPPLRAQLQQAERSGKITRLDVDYVVPYVGSLGLPYVVGSYERSDSKSIVVRTMISKYDDGYSTQGTLVKFEVDDTTIVERRLGVSAALNSLERDEIVVIATRDGVSADRITAMVVKKQ
jgi:hypothetical protein